MESTLRAMLAQQQQQQSIESPREAGEERVKERTFKGIERDREKERGGALLVDTSEVLDESTDFLCSTMSLFPSLSAVPSAAASLPTLSPQLQPYRTQYSSLSTEGKDISSAEMGGFVPVSISSSFSPTEMEQATFLQSHQSSQRMHLYPPDPQRLPYNTSSSQPATSLPVHSTTSFTVFGSSSLLSPNSSVYFSVSQSHPYLSRTSSSSSIASSQQSPRSSRQSQLQSMERTAGSGVFLQPAISPVSQVQAHPHTNSYPVSISSAEHTSSLSSTLSSTSSSASLNSPRLPSHLNASFPPPNSSPNHSTPPKKSTNSQQSPLNQSKQAASSSSSLQQQYSSKSLTATDILTEDANASIQKQLSISGKAAGQTEIKERGVTPWTPPQTATTTTLTTLSSESELRPSSNAAVVISSGQSALQNQSNYLSILSSPGNISSATQQTSTTGDSHSQSSDELLSSEQELSPEVFPVYGPHFTASHMMSMRSPSSPLPSVPSFTSPKLTVVGPDGFPSSPLSTHSLSRQLMAREMKNSSNTLDGDSEQGNGLLKEKEQNARNYVISGGDSDQWINPAATPQKSWSNADKDNSPSDEWRDRKAKNLKENGGGTGKIVNVGDDAVLPAPPKSSPSLPLHFHLPRLSLQQSSSPQQRNTSHSEQGTRRTVSSVSTFPPVFSDRQMDASTTRLTENGSNDSQTGTTPQKRLQRSLQSPSPSFFHSGALQLESELVTHRSKDSPESPVSNSSGRYKKEKEKEKSEANEEKKYASTNKTEEGVEEWKRKDDKEFFTILPLLTDTVSSNQSDSSKIHEDTGSSNSNSKSHTAVQLTSIEFKEEGSIKNSNKKHKSKKQSNSPLTERGKAEQSARSPPKSDKLKRHAHRSSSVQSQPSPRLSPLIYHPNENVPELPTTVTGETYPLTQRSLISQQSS